MSITGPNPQDPSYRSEFNQSVNLFEKSFKAMQSSTVDAQRAQYLKVMRESLKIMQQTASEMVNQHLIDMKEKLASDLRAYLADPTDPQKRQQVQSDINRLRG